MPDKFIEWDRDRLVVAEGTASGEKAQFQLVKILERQADPNDTFVLVDQLKQLFPVRTDRKRASAAIVFPRQMVTIHRIQLPQVPDSEIPDMIRLQASMRLTVPVESVCMDFTPLPVQAGSATRDVLLVTVPNDQVAVARRTLNDAGLELTEVRVSAFCVAQAAAHAGFLRTSTDPEKVDVVAVMRRDFIELTFVRGTSVVFSHSGSSWTSLETVERTIRAELTRARMSAAEVLGEHKIDRMILIGVPEVTSAVTDQLSTRLDGARIERINPSEAFFSGALPEGTNAADLVTLCRGHSGRCCDRR
ncbi:MAG: pilus assembly protein PilM [Planctomycetaceae bacterium]